MSLCLCNPLLESRPHINKFCLGASWLFQDLQVEEKMKLLAASGRQEHRKGDVIFQQGTPAGKMFLIKYGRLKISKILDDGSEMILDIRQAGDFMGEQIFWSEFLYPCSATCLEDSYTCSFTREAFEKLVLDVPEIGLAVIRNLSRRIEFLYSKDNSLVTRDLEEKVYGMLSNLGRTYGTARNGYYEISFPLSHEELGFLMGIHRVSVTRVMKTLKNTGLVRKERRKLFVSIEQCVYQGG